MVSMRTYVLFSTCERGVRDMEGETVGVRDPLGVLDGVGDPLGVPEGLGVKVGVLEKEPPAVGVPDSVADRVVVPDGVEDLVVLLVPDCVFVPEGVLLGVKVGDEVLEGDPPAVIEEVWLGVGLGEGCIKPCTYRGPAYCVPALVTEFHTFVGKLPAVVPVQTLVRLSSP